MGRRLFAIADGIRYNLMSYYSSIDRFDRFERRAAKYAARFGMTIGAQKETADAYMRRTHSGET
jgi:hypothetical protein